MRDGFRALLGDPRGELALGAITHDLVLRFLSALDLRARPRLVTTDGEFHTLRRQLGAAGRGAARRRARAGAAGRHARRAARRGGRRAHRAPCSCRRCCSRTRAIVPRPRRAGRGVRGARGRAARRRLPRARRDAVRGAGRRAWVIGGGYKYLQLGEGNCFLRLPEHAYGLRPAITGWYAEFGELADGAAPGPGRLPARRRALRRLDLRPDEPLPRRARVRVLRRAGADAASVLRASYRRQVDAARGGFDALDLARRARHARPRDAARALRRLPRAALAARRRAAARARRARRARPTAAASWLRLGPAPYLSDAQLEEAVAALGAVAAQRP